MTQDEKAKIIVLTDNDTYMTLDEWQKVYGLSGDQIGKHFSIKEPKFQEDIKRYGKIIVCAPLIKVADRTRDIRGVSLHVNSFNRDETKQNELKESGARTATHSPHVAKMAMDLDTFSNEDTFNLVKAIRQASKDTGIPVRIGYKDYMEIGQTFVHVDVCPLYFANGMPRHNEPHPAVWENEIEW